MQETKNDRSLGELFTDLTRETGTLVRKEIELATTEMTQKASKAGRNVASIVIGGAVAYAGLLGILAAVVIGLATIGLSWWLSAFLVGLVVAAIGYFMIQKGLDALKKVDIAPRQTIETLKEDTEWVKEQTR